MIYKLKKLPQQGLGKKPKYDQVFGRYGKGGEHSPAFTLKIHLYQSIGLRPLQCQNVRTLLHNSSHNNKLFENYIFLTATRRTPAIGSHKCCKHALQIDPISNQKMHESFMAARTSIRAYRVDISTAGTIKTCHL